MNPFVLIAIIVCGSCLLGFLIYVAAVVIAWHIGVRMISDEFDPPTNRRRPKKY